MVKIISGLDSMTANT